MIPAYSWLLKWRPNFSLDLEFFENVKCMWRNFENVKYGIAISINEFRLALLKFNDRKKR